jgi:hypothetical protein
LPRARIFSGFIKTIECTDFTLYFFFNPVMDRHPKRDQIVDGDFAAGLRLGRGGWAGDAQREIGDSHENV